MAFAAKHCRVFIGDVEIPYVRAVAVTAPVDGMVTTTLELIGGVSLQDGIFRIEGPPALGPVVVGLPDGNTYRAISFTGVPEPLTE